VHESTILSCPPPTCIAHPGAMLLHDYWAVYDPPSDISFVYHTPYHMCHNYRVRAKAKEWPRGLAYLRQDLVHVYYINWLIREATPTKVTRKARRAVERGGGGVGYRHRVLGGGMRG